MLQLSEWAISDYFLSLFGRRPIGPLARRAKRARGDFFSNAYVNSIMRLLISSWDTESITGLPLKNRGVSLISHFAG